MFFVTLVSCIGIRHDRIAAHTLFNSEVAEAGSFAVSDRPQRPHRRQLERRLVAIVPAGQA